MKHVMLIMLVLMSTSRTVSAVGLAEVTACQNQLGLCNNYVKALTNENDLLQKKITVLTEQRDDAESKLEEATKENATRIPAYMWVIMGLAVGATAAELLHK